MDTPTRGYTGLEVIPYPEPVVGAVEDDNPRSIYNFLPHFLKELVGRIPMKFFELTEAELMDITCGEDRRQQRNAPASRLRLALWREYERCQQGNIQVIHAPDMIRGICNIQYFKNRFITNPANLALILTPPADYMLTVKEILSLGLERLREGLLVSPVLPGGQVDTKLLDIQRRIVENVDMRINGAIIQRIDQRQLNVNVDANKDPEMAARAMATPLTMQELEEKIKQVELKSKQLTRPGAVHPDLMTKVKEKAVIISQDEKSSSAPYEIPEVVRD